MQTEKHYNYWISLLLNEINKFVFDNNIDIKKINNYWTQNLDTLLVSYYVILHSSNDNNILREKRIDIIDHIQLFLGINMTKQQVKKLFMCIIFQYNQYNPYIKFIKYDDFISQLTNGWFKNIPKKIEIDDMLT
jgi:hypothetical protein